MLPFLDLAGLCPTILFSPPRSNETPDLAGVAEQAVASKCNVVVLQKVHGPGAINLARQLAAARIRTIYSVCDLVDAAMVEATDATIIVTEYLRSLYPAFLQPRIHVVHDGIERPLACKTYSDTEAQSADAPLRAVLVTSARLNHLPVVRQAPDWVRVRIVGRYARGLRKWQETRWELNAQPARKRLEYLRFLADYRIRCIPWDSEGVYAEMMRADVGIIPVETTASETNTLASPAWKVKSENRLTMKMSIGLPVVATPIPSYESVIEHGVNGLFARSERDWKTCLTSLRDPARRREMGLAARNSVVKKYSMHEQAAKLVTILEKVCAKPH